MSNYLMAFATNWNAKVGKKCHFQALLPDGTKLPLLADTNDIEPFYKVPDTAAEVTLTATPADSPSPYWPTTVTLTNGATGLTAKAGSEGFVRLQTMQFPLGDIGNKAFIFLSRFKDATQTAVNLLANAPTPDDLTYHRNNWAGWPPGDWGLPKLTAVPFIDPNTPVMKSGALNFAPSDLVVQTTSMVLQLAGVDAPQLFSVAWPNAIKPAPGVAPVPMPFLVFLEQTLTINSAGCQIASKCDPFSRPKMTPSDGAETGVAEPRIAEQSRSWRAASDVQEAMRGS